MIRKTISKTKNYSNPIGIIRNVLKLRENTNGIIRELIKKHWATTLRKLDFSEWGHWFRA